MNSRTRALIALVLTLALPLRVYAAVAMEFCTPTSHGVMHAVAHSDESVVGDSDHTAHGAAAASAEEASPAGAHPDDLSGLGSAHAAPHSGACASCCCAALIAAAPLQFNLHPSLPPEAPPFTRNAIASFVSDGLDRPPQSFLA